MNHAKGQFFEFLDYIFKLPVFQKLENKAKYLQKIREFPTKIAPDNHGHLLLRPIGQTILTRAVAELLSKRELFLDQIFEKITSFDRNGGFEAYRRNSIWWGVTL